MILFAETATPRLQHVVAWLGNYLMGQPVKIITDKTSLTKEDIILNYSNQLLPYSCFQLQPHSLLFENVIQPQHIDIQYRNNLPHFFATAGDFPFDVLAASFYLTQRYEEYLPHEKDKYGRYAHTNSIAFKSNFLHLPIVDLWMQDFKTALQNKFGHQPLKFVERQFSYIPTYDVDIAYNYLGKGWLRNMGGLLRSVIKLQLRNFIEGMNVLTAGKKDPFDVFEELNELHSQYHLQPIYFFLLAQQQRGVDKNINPAKQIYQNLIKKFLISIKPESI